jgi:hypothetical protein
MKRVFLVVIFALVVLLSSCHAQKFTYGNSQIKLDSELSKVLELMMKKGNYDDNLLVPYNRTSLYIDYSKETVIVETVQFSVYRKYDDGEYQFDWTGCFNVNGDLKCREERGKFTGTEVGEEILLTESFEIFSNIDVPSIVSMLRETYNIVNRENILLQAHLVLPLNIEEKEEKLENIIYYYDDEYHYDNIYEPTEMMLEIKADFFGSGAGEVYIIYYEID